MPEKEFLKSLKKQSRNLKIGSWNLQGGAKAKMTSLFKDFSFYGVDICSLQETKISDEVVEKSSGQIIFLKTKNIHYGLGFYVSSRVLPYLIDYKSVTDRISVILFSLSKRDA